MKFKKRLLIISIFLAILCVGCVSASDNTTVPNTDDTNTTIENENIDTVTQPTINETSVQENTTNTNSTTNTNTTDTNTTTPTKQETKKIEAYVIGSSEFIKNSNKYFKIKVGNLNKAQTKFVFYKNVKVTVKVKIGKTTKTYNVKTNSKGEAKLFNVKNLKVGTYKVTVTSNDARYKISEKGFINIYNKKQKTITLKINKYKKVKGDYIDNIYITKNGQYKKGVYATSYNAKKPQDGNPHTLVLKAQFFFKNKKTGKIITKTVKTKDNNNYLVKDLPYHKLISGYKPIKTKIWYVTL